MNRKLRISGKVRVGKEFELDATVEGEGEAASTVARIAIALGLTALVGCAIFIAVIFF